MCSIYVINVGANTSHSSQARSPIFNNGPFVYVSFCADKKEKHRTDYPEKMLPFTSQSKDNLKTHNDPDWFNMTYGDILSGRGAALKKVNCNDILLFWGLLYHNKCSDWKNIIPPKGACWKTFLSPLDKNKGWYLLGAVRVEKIVVSKHTLDRLFPDERCRIKKNVVTFDGLSQDECCRVKNNAHCCNGVIKPNHCIFLGYKDKKHSRLFEKAVELWVPKCKPQDEWESSLMRATFRAKDGPLSLNGSPRWYSSLRSCRKMWELGKSEDHKLAKQVRDAIRKQNEDFDLLADI